MRLTIKEIAELVKKANSSPKLGKEFQRIVVDRKGEKPKKGGKS